MRTQLFVRARQAEKLADGNTEPRAYAGQEIDIRARAPGLPIAHIVLGGMNLLRELHGVEAEFQAVIADDLSVCRSIEADQLRFLRFSVAGDVAPWRAGFSSQTYSLPSSREVTSWLFAHASIVAQEYCAVNTRHPIGKRRQSRDGSESGM